LSDANSTQLPNQRHKINTLFSTTIKNYADHRRRHAKQVDKTVEIEITKAELEEKFFKGKSVNIHFQPVTV
jgi:septin family protein